MDPELVKQADGLHGHDHHRRKTGQRHPQPENPRHRSAGPGLAQCSAKVVPLRRMMHHVRCPEETALMAGAMEPVITEIVSKEDEHPRPPCPSHMKQSELIDEGEDA